MFSIFVPISFSLLVLELIKFSFLTHQLTHVLVQIRKIAQLILKKEMLFTRDFTKLDLILLVSKIRLQTSPIRLHFIDHLFLITSSSTPMLSLFYNIYLISRTSQNLQLFTCLLAYSCLY